MSADADTALVNVMYDVPVTHPDVMGKMTPLEDATAGRWPAHAQDRAPAVVTA